ncbi:hypothetical protein BCR39DRAFT_165171 [Naematelia encephala]|uniref:Uncharacterized protein n=1 Tax=Naematelia encephala TaxID=71784 RepID=A0A1Y2B576_9TREE|nr:hypothetical protein BCR39DRAFT_165171 [Naematelia encephala]
MSRRREAAELARVLLLSTQEATTAARISPHTLSSSDKHATQDSKDMELRPYEPHGRDNLAAARVVMQPTVRPTDVMGPPESLVVLSSSGSGSGARSDQVRGTATNTTSDVPTSAIRSFTPSGSSNRPPLVIPLSLNQPTTFSRTNQHQLSSPPNAPGPSHVFTPDKPTSSGDSSDRPLFSPTQKSSQPGPAVQDPACQPPQVITYGKSSNRVGGGTTPTTARKAHALTSSPAAGPTRAAESWSRGPFTVSSDNEVEEEVKEPNSKPRSTVQVVLPRRDKSIHRPAENRHASPDPLYGLIDNADPASTSARKSLQSRSSVAAEESQVSADGSGPGRRSSRVKENVEKKQAEQEARRKARRERKAREAEEERRRESGEASPENRRKSTTTSREERRKRRSSEVLVLVDETMPSTETTTRTRENRDKSSTPAVPAPTPHTETKDTAPDSRKRKSRFGEDEDELDSWHGSADEGAASPVKKVKAKAKDKKGNGRQKAASRTKPKGSHMVEVLQDEEEAERVDVAHEEKNTMAEDVEDEETTMRVDKAQDGEKTMKRRSEDDVPHEPEPSEQGDADIQVSSRNVWDLTNKS